MSTPASIRGHPIHPMFVGIPIGLWVFSLIADMIHLLGWGGPSWRLMALATIGGGIVGGLLAAVPGLIDLLSIKHARVRRIALTHMTVNLVVLGIFAVSFWLKWMDWKAGLSVGLSALGIARLGISGWLGGELVFIHGMGMASPRPGTREPSRRR
jgi:uncharacterized membrane protein